MFKYLIYSYVQNTSIKTLRSVSIVSLPADVLVHAVQIYEPL